MHHLPTPGGYGFNVVLTRRSRQEPALWAGLEALESIAVASDVFYSIDDPIASIPYRLRAADSRK